MGDPEKKRLKAQVKAQKTKAKADKKQAKGQLQSRPSADSGAQSPDSRPGRLVKFAEYVRGIVFLIFAVSLAVALILPSTGHIITLNEIVERLMPLWFGKLVLAAVAAAFFIYGLKCLRTIK